MYYQKLILSWSAFATLFVVAVGCSASSETVPVHGIVLLDGRPLQNAEVIFQPEGKRASIGKTDANGYYQLSFTANQSGGIVGMNRVIISKMDNSPNGKELLPSRYNLSTELVREVKDSGSNEFDFDLKS